MPRLSLHLLLLVLYSLALTAAGLWISRLVRGSGDFFVAGRSLSAPLIFSTMLAANIGAGTMVGATGVAYAEGVSAWWWNGSAAIGSLVLAFWVGPRMWKLAADHGFYTAGDFLEFRYDRRVRGIVAALLWLGTLALLAAQLIVGAAVLSVVAGLSRPLGVLVGAVVMTGYFVAGGLLGSARVNALQLVMLLGGFLAAVPLLYGAIGGTEGLAAMPVPHDAFWDPLYSTGAGLSGWAMLFVLTPSFIVSPGLLQKAFGAADARAVRVGVAWQAIAQMLFACLPVFFGLAARAADLRIGAQREVLPALLATELPPALGAFALAAVFSAEVSTCDAILFMLATSLSKDLYQGFVNPAADDRQLLRVARGAALAGGAAGAVLALALSTLVDALAIFYSLMSVSLFVPVVGGLVSRRAGPPEALAAIAAGVGTLLFVKFVSGGLGPFNENMLGLAAAAAAFTGILYLRRQPAGTRAL